MFSKIYPVGQSIEIINKKIFLEVCSKKLDGQAKEHITQFFTKFKKYNIFNVSNKLIYQKFINKYHGRFKAIKEKIMIKFKVEL